MGEKKLDTGGIVYRAGDTADASYVVVSGKIEIMEMRDGREVEIDLVTLGKAFGEHAVFDPMSLRQFTARAQEPSTLTTITPEEFQARFAECPPDIRPLLQLAFEKMKAAKVRTKTSMNDAVLEGDVTKIVITPASDKLKATLKPIEVPVGRLPFRIGGYPENGEVSRRDAVHLSIASQDNPLRVSRQHCEIGVENKGIAVTDLGSRFNTHVNGTILGRGKGHYIAPLVKGDNELILGAADGPYKFKVTCS